MIGRKMKIRLQILFVMDMVSMKYQERNTDESTVHRAGRGHDTIC